MAVWQRSSEPAVAIKRKPKARAHWQAISPTPPAAAKEHELSGLQPALWQGAAQQVPHGQTL